MYHISVVRNLCSFSTSNALVFAFSQFACAVSNMVLVVVLLVRAGGGGAGPRAGAGGGGGTGSVGGMNFGTSFAPRPPTSSAPRHNCNKVRVLFYCFSVTSIGFYCFPFRAYSAKFFKKVAQTLLLSAPYHADWADLMEICRESIGKFSAKPNSSTTLVAALPCRLDMSSDNSNCLGYIGVRAACTLQSAAK